MARKGGSGRSKTARAKPPGTRTRKAQAKTPKRGARAARARKPAVRKPAVRKPAARKPAARKPAAQRFHILVCIDGSPESDRALKYAVRIGSGTDADMTLLYVRPIDQGLMTGGLQLSVARENLLNWGLELPGTKALNKARDTLVELGFLSKDWAEEYKHSDIQGDPLGDNMVIYHSDDGRDITLKLLVSPSVGRGILDQCDLEDYAIVILGVCEDTSAGQWPGQIDQAIAELVAVEHRGTVLVARELEESHGHLVCVRNNEQSIQAARRDAEIASRCACPIFLYSVARDEDELPEADAAVANAQKAIKKVGINISGKKVEIGDPVEMIIEEGRDYSVIVMSSTSRTGLRRFFTASTAFRVLQRARNSVMIAR